MVHTGVQFEALQFIERAEIRVVVVEIDNQSESDLAVFEVI